MASKLINDNISVDEIINSFNQICNDDVTKMWKLLPYDRHCQCQIGQWKKSHSLYAKHFMCNGCQCLDKFVELDPNLLHKSFLIEAGRYSGSAVQLMKCSLPVEPQVEFYAKSKLIMDNFSKNIYLYLSGIIPNAHRLFIYYVFICHNTGYILSEPYMSLSEVLKPHPEPGLIENLILQLVVICRNLSARQCNLTLIDRFGFVHQPVSYLITEASSINDSVIRQKKIICPITVKIKNPDGYNDMSVDFDDFRLMNTNADIVEEQEIRNDYLCTESRLHKILYESKLGVPSKIKNLTMSLFFYWTILMWLRDKHFAEGFWNSKKNLWYYLFPKYLDVEYQEEDPLLFLKDKLINLDVIEEMWNIL